MEKLVHFQDSFPKERTVNRKLDTRSSQIPVILLMGKKHKCSLPVTFKQCRGTAGGDPPRPHHLPPAKAGGKCRREASCTLKKKNEPNMISAQR